MIPKIVHYCWFGETDYSPLIIDCMQTWKVYADDFNFIKWDETNSPVNNIVVKIALKKEMWAFAADYVRLYALYHYGGIYLDTDMELIKPLDPLLGYKGFLGFESDNFINAGIIGFEPNSEMIRRAMDIMEKRVIRNEPFITIPYIINEAIGMLPEKNTIVNGVYFFAEDYFYPYYLYNSKRKELLYKDITSNTYAIHHWQASWIKEPSLLSLVGLKIKNNIRSVIKKNA